jgi:hypothetical protein
VPIEQRDVWLFHLWHIDSRRGCRLEGRGRWRKG